MGWIRKSFPVDREGLTVLKSTLPWRWWENVECRGGGGHALHQSITLWWSIWGWDPPLLLLPVPTGTRTLFWSQHTAAYLLMIRRSDDQTMRWSQMIRSWPDLTAIEGPESLGAGQWKSRVIENKIAAGVPCGPHVTSVISASWTKPGYLCIYVFVYRSIFVYLKKNICVLVLLRTKWRRSQVCSQCVNQFLSFNCRLWFRQSATNPPISWSLPQTKQPEKYLQISIGKSSASERQSAQRQEERVINFPFQINLWSGKLAFPGWSLLCSWFGPAINLINKLQSTRSHLLFSLWSCDRLSNGSPARFYSWSLGSCHLLGMITHWWKTTAANQNLLYMLWIFVNSCIQFTVQYSCFTVWSFRV